MKFAEEESIALEVSDEQNRMGSRKRCSQECLEETATVVQTSQNSVENNDEEAEAKQTSFLTSDAAGGQTLPAAANDCDSARIESAQNSSDNAVDLPLPDTASDPDDYLLTLLESMSPKAKKLKVKAAADLNSFFPIITEEQMARYSMKVVNMARAGDAKALRDFYSEDVSSSASTNSTGNVLDCFNRFGEGLLNMACRRGFVSVVDLLLSDPVSLTVRVRDDGGRTPLHDACWNPEPQLEICAWILQRDPSLFLVADKRGYTPFQYARQSDWPVWCKFLYDNREHLKQLGRDDIAETFMR